MGGHGHDAYVLLDSASTYLHCSICTELFVDPLRAPCGHSFCRNCITDWLQRSQTCPEDRKPCSLAQMHADFIVANIISELRAACVHRKRGCTFVGSVASVSIHTTGCHFKNLPEALLAGIVEDEDDEDDVIDVAPPPLRMRLFAAGLENGAGSKTLLGILQPGAAAAAAAAAAPAPAPAAAAAGAAASRSAAASAAASLIGGRPPSKKRKVTQIDLTDDSEPAVVIL